MKITLREFGAATIFLGCMYSASAQVAGGGSAANWQDQQYAPMDLKGALLLRIGRSGIAEGINVGDPRFPQIARGNPTCDVSYLYSVFSHIPLSQEMLEECALNEYKLVSKWTYASVTALNDSYARKDIIEKFIPVVQARIQQIMNAQFYYVHPYDTEVAAVNPNTNMFGLSLELLDVNWRVSDGPSAIVLSGPDVYSNKFEVIIPADPDLGRNIEYGRLHGLIDRHKTIVMFKVIGVTSLKTSYGSVRGISIDDIKWRIAYFDQNNKYNLIGTIQ